MWGVLLVAFIVLGLVRGLNAEPARNLPHATDMIISDYSALAFPPSLAGMKRISCHECECRSGMSCSYSVPHLVEATIYIAASGLIDVPDGAESEAVKKYLALSSLPVTKRESSRNGHLVKAFSEGKKPIKRTKEPRSFLYRCFQFKETEALEMIDSFPGDDGIRKSYVLVTGYNRSLIKVRFTFPMQKDEEGEQYLERFLDGLGGMFLDESRY